MVNNSILYRGYYYDRDLSLYYLLSRYYDANTGRFISPDDVSYLGANGDLSSYNLYAYCSNNPITYVDPTGHSISAIVAGAIIGFAFGFTNSIISQITAAEVERDYLNLLEAFYDGVCGALSGIIASGSASILVSIGAGAALGGTSSIGKDLLFNDGNINWSKAGFSTITGAVTALIGGSGANNPSAGGARVKIYKQS